MLAQVIPFLSNAKKRKEGYDMTKRGKRALLAAGILAGAAAMTGCTAQTTPAATSTPPTNQQETAGPMQTAEASASPEASPSPEGGDESPAPLGLTAGGQGVEADAVAEGDRLLLPLAETAEALGWKAESESLEEETQTRRTVTLTREDSRITVSWVVSDNTARQITWQKDGLLVPVDTYLTTIGDVVYVPAAFFEEAMGVGIKREGESVSISTPEPKETPEKEEQSGGESG